jgi:hypothetical protein
MPHSRALLSEHLPAASWLTLLTLSTPAVPSTITTPQRTTQPAAVPNAVAFACAVPAINGTTCTSSCLTGFTGAPSATCLSSGAWSITGTCVAGGGSTGECQV